MKIFYSDMHRAHTPPFEVFDGGIRVPYLENPDRMDKILAALHQVNWTELHEPTDFGLEPIHAVHDRDYIAFLASAWTEWLESDPDVAAAPEKYVFLPATFALRRHPPRPISLLGRAGYYIMDLSACIVAGTYEAALASANCALSAAEQVIKNDRAAFALCRPPGHHAGKDYGAGYCFINNASVAANWLSSRGKVTILDIDYHAGNGTQDIFYERDDVLTISLHSDPDYEYPHFAGYAQERGQGKGLGFHRNFPLPAGTEDTAYLSTLDEAIKVINRFSPKYLVVSAGMDTFDGDPLGKFKLSRKGIGEIGHRISKLNLPTAIVMEGGYNNIALGENIVELLQTFL
jgi:acetoin utilization deacetylase AcuC-like enzyme